MMYVFHNHSAFEDPFYQTKIQPFPWEVELLHSDSLRRLKFLSHYGTGTFITGAKHSRFEHTIGVWTIISTFFPQDEELRIAALLHDIGHLPFSHAVERTLGFNHHHITEEKIRGEEISTILQAYGFSPGNIIKRLNEDSPLTHKTSYLSADHLDSFLRDSYMLGKCKQHPADILRNISFSHHYVEADLETSRIIMESIYYDHQCFLHPLNLALDSLLAKAISIFTREQAVDLHSIRSLTNNELLQLLLRSKIQSVQELMDIILWYPEKIVIHSEEVEGADQIDVHKVYDKSPLVNGVPLTSLCPEAQNLIERIRALKKRYFMTYS